MVAERVQDGPVSAKRERLRLLRRHGSPGDDPLGQQGSKV